MVTVSDRTHMARRDSDPYLRRIGVDPGSVGGPDRDTVERLQRAHVTAVPFETLAITGDPFGNRGGDGVSLEVADCYAKIVERGRGGFCYELNGLFGWLLADLGFEFDRVAAMVLSGGDPSTPANHLTHVVSLDRRYVVDVGIGGPLMRRPLPLDGQARTDAAGVTWRVVPSDRPDVDYVTQYRRPGEDRWSDMYVFADVHRERHFFEATCEYLSTAPESPFTGDPLALTPTERGHLKLSGTTLTRVVDGEESERELDEQEWYGVLEDEFGLAFEAG